MTTDYLALARSLAQSLRLQVPPIAVCLTDQVPASVPAFAGRPACAVVPHVVNQRATALSLGCCGARAYLDVLSDDVAIFALPGARLDAYVARIAELAKANSVLASFHALRRQDVEAGASPTVKQSLERLSAR